MSNVKLEMSKPTTMEVAEEGEPSELRAMTSGMIDQLGSVCRCRMSDERLKRGRGVSPKDRERPRGILP